MGYGKKCPFCGAAMPEESHFCLSCFSMCTMPKPEPAAGRAKPAAILPGRKCLAERIVSAALTLILVIGMALPFATVEKDIPMQKESPNAENADDTATGAASQTAASQTNMAAPSEDTEEDPAQRAFALSLPQQVIAAVVGQTGLSGTDAALPGVQTPAGAIGNSSGGVDTPDETPGTETPGTVTPGTDTSNSADPSEEEVDSEDCWVYENEDGSTKYVKITKYTGNATKVTVPTVLGGRPVVRIAKRAFADNDRITEITFANDAARPHLILNSSCFYNLTALKVVRLPETDLGVHTEFAKGCVNLANIEVDNWQFIFQDGCLYYYNSKEWIVQWYAPACKNTTLTVASWCAGIGSACNLQENPYLKHIVLHKNVKSFPSQYWVNSALETVTVEAGNTSGFSVDGVLFHKSSTGEYSFSLYPESNKTKIFKMPENVKLNIMPFKNAYLEEIWIPKSSGVSSQDSLYFRRCFTNLKVIHLQEGHSYEEKCKSTFTGITEMY